MTDKELNKAICKELQKIAISLLNTCKGDLAKNKNYFITSDLVKLYKETPWIFRTEFDHAYEVSVCVDDFRCTFCIGSVFHLLSKFEKLSGEKDTVFEIIEERNESGVSLEVIVGSLPENVAKVKITCYAKNGNDIVNRNMILTKVSDVAYIGDKDESGLFDTYLKTVSGTYLIGKFSVEQANTLTIDMIVSLYTRRIESFSSFGLIDLKLIGDVIPDRFNEAKELRDEWLKKKEAFDKETERLRIEEKERAAIESRKKIEEKKEAIKSARMDKANNTRLENRLDKLVRYNGGVLTVKEYLHALKDTGHTPEVSEKSSVKYNRAKYNRMGYAEQQEYDRKLEKMAPMYIAINSDRVFNELNKLEFDYFSSLFEKCEAVDVVESRPVDGDDAEIDALRDPEVLSATDQTNEAVTAADRNVVCIECEPEDVPDYWDFLDYEAGTTKPDPVCLNAIFVQEPERVLPDKEDSIPIICATERLPAVFEVDRLAGNYTPERLHVFAPVSRRFLVTNKGMYYLIA